MSSAKIETKRKPPQQARHRKLVTNIDVAIDTAPLLPSLKPPKLRANSGELIITILSAMSHNSHLLSSSSPSFSLNTQKKYMPP
ncbi:hypothetical protein WAI453_008711 [Rhynchosporium graminicola]